MVQQKVYDVIIVGAGLSGIGTAYWLQEKCPDKSYTILEARDALGGTWDLFRYPGVRSDSDMFTFGYRFKPWDDPKSLSDGQSILDYLEDTASEFGIDEHIQFNHKVLRANWESEKSLWTVQVQSKDGVEAIQCNFLYMCSGYYSYNEAHRPHFDGEEAFEGTVVHPQFWPKGLDYSDQKVVVVGSGATAVTLVPAMAEKVEKITMLQRSPTYVMKLPNKNKFYKRLKSWLPDRTAFRMSRWRNIYLSMLLFGMSKSFPKLIRKKIMKEAAEQLPDGFDVKKHFNPSYKPWDQRLCVVPDGDLFKAISSGKADVVTDEIEYFTNKGLTLKSGEELDADIVIMATGLKMQLLGGAKISLDGQPVDTSDRFVFKGMMISGVPNLSLAIGYTNNSWTLKTDLTASYVCRLLNYMDRKGYQTVVAKKEEDMDTIPLLNLNSGYIERAKDTLPQQGTKAPWRVYQNYIKDLFATRFSKVNHRVLEFE